MPHESGTRALGSLDALRAAVRSWPAAGRSIGRLAQGLARFLDTEEVTGSNPVSPTHVMCRDIGSAAPVGDSLVMQLVGLLWS